MSNVTVTDPATGTGYPVPEDSWQAQVLKGIGAPLSFNNVRSLTLWANSEGIDPKNNNWLATSQLSDAQGNKLPTAGWIVQPSGNQGVGIPAFGSFDAGVKATVATILQYPSITGAFRSSAGEDSIYTAVNGSAWCKGCQNGQYPVQLAGDIYGAVTGLTGPGATSPPAGTVAGGTQGATGAPADECVWKVGPWCVVNRPIAGAAAMAAGGLVMLIGTIVILFRFQGTRQVAETVAAVPVAGRVAKIASGRSPGPRRSSAPKKAAPSRPGPRREPPMSDQDYEDANSEMRHKRMQAEGELGPRGGATPRRRAEARKAMRGERVA